MLSAKRVALIIFLTILFPSMAIARDVTLAWDANTDSNLAGYRLYARESAQAYDYSDHEWQGTAIQCTVRGFDEYESYYFVVRAYDRDGNESGDSNEVYLASTIEDDTGDNAIDNNDDGSSSVGGGGSGCFISSLLGR
jgi:hypothetical protein